jgi:hypothetical protein
MQLLTYREKNASFFSYFLLINMKIPTFGGVKRKHSNQTPFPLVFPITVFYRFLVSVEKLNRYLEHL